jgi:hypothetical protein
VLRRLIELLLCLPRKPMMFGVAVCLYPRLLANNTCFIPNNYELASVYDDNSLKLFLDSAAGNNSCLQIQKIIIFLLVLGLVMYFGNFLKTQVANTPLV